MAWLLGYEINHREHGGTLTESKQFYLLTFRKMEHAWKQVAVCLAAGQV
jgi:hypothetical protein